MIFLERKGLTLQLNADIIPAQGSSDVPVKYIDDSDTYQGFIPQISVGWVDGNGLPHAVLMNLDTEGNYLIPSDAFKFEGYIYFSVGLVDPNNPRHVEKTIRTQAFSSPAPTGTVILPSEAEWQELVKNYMDSLFEKNYGPDIEEALQNINDAVDTANAASETSSEATKKVYTAFSNLGDYKVENGVIFFKKADGTWNEQGITLAGQSTITDANGNVILDVPMTLPQNLLINSDFQINQRGQTSYQLTNNVALMYTLDMWSVYVEDDDNSITVTVESDGVLIETTGTGKKQFFQTLTNRIQEYISNFTGVASFYVESISGNVAFEKWSFDDSLFEKITDVSQGLNVGYINNKNIGRIQFTFNGVCSLKLKFVDLFEGSIAYPHVVEDNVNALIECQNKIREYELTVVDYSFINNDNLYYVIPNGLGNDVSLVVTMFEVLNQGMTGGQGFVFGEIAVRDKDTLTITAYKQNHGVLNDQVKYPLRIKYIVTKEPL